MIRLPRLPRLPRLLAVVSALAVSAAVTSPAPAQVRTQTVEYPLPGGATARGFLAVPDPAAGSADARRPAVLVVPEWWGLTEYPKRRARELADRGYVALVADMYGDGATADTPARAKELAGRAHGVGLATLAAPALALLKQTPGVDGSRVAAIGFCFGGSTVADLVKAGADLQAAVSFHGGLGPDLAPAAGPDPKTPFLVLHGGADPLVPAPQFAQFVQKSIEAGVPLTVVSFPGAVHAFTNPDAGDKGMTGVAYDERAATLSMRIMHDFFEMTLAPQE